MKRHLYILCSLLLLPFMAIAQEVTDEQYDEALKAITPEATYYIYTMNDGVTEGKVRYYLTDDGWLTKDLVGAGKFTFHKIEGSDLYKSPGWQVDQYFTNPNCWNGSTEWMLNEGHIRSNANSDLQRDNWEGQVWYKSDDTYAVRATNSPYDSWGASSFWNVLEDADGDGLPNADYSLTPQFTWRLEKISDAPELVDPSIKEVSRLTNLPHVYINTFNGKNITSKTNYVYARMWYVDEDDNVQFFDSLQIRGRGNATWGMAKKPYKLKFNQKEKLLGKGYANAKKWTMLANHGDKTLIRNAVTREMGEFVGLKNNPAAKFIDLTFNDRYDGTYQISDQVEVRAHRVKVAEQDYPLTETSDITGGYLFEAIRSDWNFRSDRGVPVRIHYPEEDEIDQIQRDYARQFIGNFEERLYSDKFADWDEGYRPLVDSVSLANWYLCTEMSGNVDGFYSTYFYKEQQDDHIYWGPLWDYDIAYNNDNRDREGKGNNTLEQLMSDVAYDNCRKWVRQMWEDPWFARLINRRFHEVVEDGIEDYLNEKIDSLTQLIDESKNFNYERWSIDTRTLRELVLYSTYDEYVNDLRDYIHDHLIYLNDAFAELQGKLPGKPDDPTPKIPEFPADTTLYYALSNVGTGTFIDTDPETNGVVCNVRDEEAQSQQWRFIPLSNGYIYIINRTTGYALCDPTEGNPTATTLTGTQLTVAAGDSLNTRQQWDLVAQSDNRFNLINRFSSHGANLSGGKNADGTPVVSYTSDERNSVSNNRMWYIEAVDKYVPLKPDMIQNLGDVDYALAYDPKSGRLHFGADNLSAMTFGVNIYNQAGHLVSSFRACDGTNLSSYPHGIYMITWKVDGRQRAVKLMK